MVKLQALPIMVAINFHLPPLEGDAAVVGVIKQLYSAYSVVSKKTKIFANDSHDDMNYCGGENQAQT